MVKKRRKKSIVVIISNILFQLYIIINLNWNNNKKKNNLFNCIHHRRAMAYHGGWAIINFKKESARVLGVRDAKKKCVGTSGVVVIDTTMINRYSISKK